MTGEKYPAHCLLVRKAQVQITAHTVVVEGTADGDCTLAGAADAGGILGIAMNDAAIGADVQIAGPGCTAKAIAAGVTTRGLWLSIEGTDGHLKNATLTADIEVVGKCMHTTTTDGDHTLVFVAPYSCQGA